MTLLSVCQDVADDLVIEKPDTIVGNSNDTARALLSSAKSAAKSLYKAHVWIRLQKEHTFTTTASTADYDMPSDYGRLLGRTVWDRSNFNDMKDGLSPVQWQAYKSSILGDTPATWKRFRITNSSATKTFTIHPTPTVTGETLVFEYVSNKWCEADDGTLKSDFTLDDDNVLFDEHLWFLGTRWRVLNRFGLAYVEERAEYEMELNKAKANEGGMKTLSITKASMNAKLLDSTNIPDTGYGS